MERLLLRQPNVMYLAYFFEDSAKMGLNFEAKY